MHDRAAFGTNNPFGKGPTGAAFSLDRVYRYGLWRRWGSPDAGAVLFVGLNPSTADETVDDPTIRRCVGFARSWGYGALYMANIFAFRATDPDDMKRAPDPIGPDNDSWLAFLATEAHLAVAAWGVHGEFLNRGARVARLLSPGLMCLGRSKGGFPRHPLYLAASTECQPFEVAHA